MTPDPDLREIDEEGMLKETHHHQEDREHAGLETERLSSSTVEEEIEAEEEEEDTEAESDRGEMFRLAVEKGLKSVLWEKSRKRKLKVGFADLGR